MIDISEAVRAHGGMAQKQQLVAGGATDYLLSAAVRRGEVIRVRNGWYSTLKEYDPRLRAVRVGGRLTGISAIAARGGWVLGRRPLHVSVPRNAARQRQPQNRFRRLQPADRRRVVLHWDDPELLDEGGSTIVSIRDSLVRVVLDESWETAVAAIDWALHTAQLDIIDFELLIKALPARLRGIRLWVDENCESLPESLARTRLKAAGYAVTSQLGLHTGGRIDLVVNDHVGLEVDGEEFHRDSFFADRDKDLVITSSNRHAIRPSARHMFDDWPRVQRAVADALAARGVVVSGNSGPEPPKRRPSRRTTRNRPPTPEFPKPRNTERGWRRWSWSE